MNPQRESTRNFGDALTARRLQAQQPLISAPELSQWLQYWNDDESFAVNMRNLEHWIACARRNGKLPSAA
jgi:hypothetical protein